MAKFSFGMILNVFFQNGPIAFITPNFFTVRADRQQTTQSFYFCQGSFKFQYQFCLFLIRFFPFTNIFKDTNNNLLTINYGGTSRNLHRDNRPIFFFNFSLQKYLTPGH